MSTHGKHAFAWFIGIFLLTRVQKLLFLVVETKDWSLVLIATALSITALVCVVMVFVCLRRRIQSARQSGEVMQSHWKWVLISIATLAYASEPVVTLYSFAQGTLRLLSQ